jgi:hypothetical protein
MGQDGHYVVWKREETQGEGRRAGIDGGEEEGRGRGEGRGPGDTSYSIKKL